MYSITGVVKVIKETEQVTDTFKKREFVITDNSSSYPQDILFQLTQDRTGLIDDVKVNDIINVSFNLRGREWTSPQGEVRYFNSLDAWRVEKNQGAAPTPTNIPPASAESAETLIDESDDDLPF